MWKKLGYSVSDICRFNDKLVEDVKFMSRLNVDFMDESEYINEIPIDNYDDLVKAVQGKTDYCDDLRDKFIFRGVEDETFKLIPSALREESKLNNYVDEDFKITLALFHEKAVECGFADENEYYEDIEHFTVNKYGNLIEMDLNDFAWSWEEFQCVKELNALMKFLSYADKVGLKVPTNQKIRQLIESKFQNIFNHEEGIWPEDDFFELMALAQHYGIPTRALDWSYDYRVSLYFAIKNILNEDYLTSEKPKNGVLWAFNYKYFDVNLMTRNKIYCTTHYRPEYNSNPNLNAQKGLFTFVIKGVNEDATQPFNNFIGELLCRFGRRKMKMPETEEVFYKFIIPEDEKPIILKELYSEGYSEEYLFPGYRGVTQTIENRIKLDRLIKK